MLRPRSEANSVDYPYPSSPLTVEGQRAFLLSRQDGIYSTDSPGILGLSRFASPRSVYLDKVEPPDVQPTSLKQWLGWQMEPTLAALYVERYGHPEDPPIRGHQTWAHPDIPWLKTHLDYRVEWWDDPDLGGDHQAPRTILVECKTRDHISADWGEDGSSQVPVDVWVQCQHQMLVTGAPICRVAVLFGLRTFRCYELRANPDFHQGLIPRLQTFWEGNVLARVQPELTGASWDVAYAKRETQEKGLGRRAATPGQAALFDEYRAVRAAQVPLKRQQDALEARIKELIGKHSGIEGTWGYIDWNTGSPRTSWKDLAGQLQEWCERLVDLAAPGDDPAAVALLAHIQGLLPDVRSLYTTPGERRLNPRLNAEEGDESDE